MSEDRPLHQTEQGRKLETLLTSPNLSFQMEMSLAQAKALLVVLGSQFLGYHLAGELTEKYLSSVTQKVKELDPTFDPMKASRLL